MSGALRPFLGAIVVIAAFFVGANAGHRSETFGDFASDLFGSEGGGVSSEALDLISERYFREVDSGALDDASIRGMVAELRKRNDDRFSHYFGPEAFARFQEDLAGRFSGVGMSVTEVKRGLRVSSVFDGSPAKAAGIRAGDVVTAVEGRPIAGQDSEIAVSKIKGKAGTEVTLTVARPSTGGEREYTLTRAELDVPAIEASMKRAGGAPVGYVRLLTFAQQGVHAELREKVEGLYDRGAEGLVIDLRGNGGGLLTEAVLTSSVFVEDGVIVSTRGRTQPDETYEAQGDALSPRPIVVLINGDTASASEIFTAALEDAGLAAVAGTTSFGKGVFQEVIELENGGALDLTVGEYLTRDGVSLAGDGIDPEIPAKDVPETRPDEGLDEALDALGERLPATAQPKGE